jgi:hypothetical protein
MFVMKLILIFVSIKVSFFSDVTLVWWKGTSILDESAAAVLWVASYTLNMKVAVSSETLLLNRRMSQPLYITVNTMHQPQN